MKQKYEKFNVELIDLFNHTFENCTYKIIEGSLTEQDTVKNALDYLFLKVNTEISKQKLNSKYSFKNFKI